MQKMKWSVIAFAVAAASTQMAVASQQSESNGFIEDSKLDLHARTLYFNSDLRNGAWFSAANANKADLPHMAPSLWFNPARPRGQYKGYREDLGLGVKAIYESGFTQGTLGFGVDAFAMGGLRLDGGGGRHGNNLFPTRGNGKPETSYSEFGGAIKARLSNTTLKYGDQFVDLPVLSTHDTRLLPETTTGFLITSEEIDGLTLHAGHFTALNAMDQTGRDSRDNGLLRSLDLVGARYNFTDNLSAAYYYSTAKLGGKNRYVVNGFWEDFNDGIQIVYNNERGKINKQYLNVNYVHPIADNQSVTVDFNAYSTRMHDRGYNPWSRDSSGKNNIRSLAVAYNIGAHTFTAGMQKSEGNSAYAYGYDGGGTIYLLNDVQYYNFAGKGEKSYQLRYDLDFAQFGVPGLSLMTRYVRGSNIASWDFNQHRERNQGKNWERDTEIRYVVQSGFAKDLSLHLLNATYRANKAAFNVDVNEVRFIVEYPLSIL